MKARPKVCHLTHDGSGTGGGGTFSLSYFPRYLPEFDTFAIVGKGGDLAPRLQAQGVRTFALPMGRPLTCLLSLPSLCMILRRERPDAIFLHGQWGGFFGALAARAAGIRTLLYVPHFPSFYTDWDIPRMVRNRIAESVTCKLASRILCLSAASRYQYLLRRFTAEEKFVHIPNGVAPLEAVENQDRLSLRRSLELPIDPEVPLVVSVSRLSDQKRIDWLLEAWALVERKTPAAQLVIVGDGPLRGELQEMAARLGLKRCHFIGPKPNGFRFYQVADLGVISSIYEGHPLALLEAMSCGCPMVGTAVDGVAETILHEKTGLLVPPGDAPKLADAMLQLLDNPEGARRMGEAARERATGLYALEGIIGRQIELLKAELAKAEDPVVGS